MSEKFLSEKYGGAVVTLLLSVVGIAASWGSNQAKITALEKDKEAQDVKIVKLEDKLSSIQTDVAVVREWVDEQKRKVK